MSPLLSAAERAEQQVPIAARLLDELRPGWFREVNPGALCMDSLDRCVLGQLYGSFLGGAHEVVVPREATHPYLMHAFSSYATERDWRREVERRRELAEEAL